MAEDESAAVRPHREDEGGAPGWRGLAVAAMLAAVGLSGGVLASRIGVLNSQMDTEHDAAQAAVRSRTEVNLEADSVVARSAGAWLEYERNRQRGVVLEAKGAPAQAAESWGEATAHWFLVQPQYASADGTYDTARYRDAVVADRALYTDIEPQPHRDNRDRIESDIRDLLVAGVVISGGLPPLAAAEAWKHRLRIWMVLTAVGVAVFASGIGLAIAAWGF